MTSKTSFYAQSGATPTEQAAIESSVNTSAASAAAAVISATSAAQSATLATSNIAANQASAAASEASRVASVAAQAASETAKTASETAQAAALVSKNAASTSATNAASSETTVSNNTATSTTKAAEAAASATASEASKVTSVASASTATTKASESSTSATNSASSATASEASRVASVAAKTASETAETNAETAESAALVSKNAAASSATASEASKVTSVASAATATTKASEASTSASNAATSASSASTSASTATTKAADSETARAASVVAKDASVVAKNSSVVAKDASVAAQAAAETAETNAETAETNSASSATASANSATASANSATASESSKVTSVSSASAASTSETNAATSETNAAASYDLFDDRMLGAKSSAPTVDNDGASLVQGTLYFDTSSQTMKVYGSSGWVPAGSSVNGTSARFKFVATNSQTTFSGSDANSQTLGYDAGFLDVYLSGLRLVNGTDFTATTGTNIVLAAGAATGDILEVVAYGTFVLANFNADKLDGQHGSYYTGYTDTAVSNLVNSSPAALNTLNELAAALGDDANFSTTVTNSIATKAALAGATFTGEITANGGIALGDHDKATFGAGDDLQIYHDAYHSYIKEIGAGSLILDGANILFRNADASKSYASMTDGGAIDLYHNNALKLSTQSTGINVVGTAAMDGLTVGDTSSGQSLIQMFANPTNGANTIHFGDGASANAYVGYINYAHDSNSMQFAVGNGEKMRIDSSGAIGFKKIPPSGSHTSWSQFFIGEKGTLISESSNSGGLYGTWLTDNMYIKQSTGAFANVTADQSSAYKQEAGIHQWFSQTSGSANAAITLVEHMRLSGGNLLLGTQGNTPSGGNAKQYNLATGTTVGLAVSVNNTGYSLLNLFYNNTTLVGAITTNGSATAYNTSSDYRLKENVVPMTGSIDRVKALKPSRFNFIVDSDTTVDGFLAHEAQEVVPECATGTKDAMVDEEYEVTAAVEEVRDEDYNITTEAVEAVMGTRSVPDMQGIDQAKLVPLLTAALQEAINRIESLEARLSALENN